VENQVRFDMTQWGDQLLKEVDPVLYNISTRVSNGEIGSGDKEVLGCEILPGFQQLRVILPGFQQLRVGFGGCLYSSFGHSYSSQ